MARIRRTKLGIQAGLLAGVTVMLLFFLLDLARFQPLATPMALGAQLLGSPFPALDAPVLSKLASVTVFAANMLALAVLHFMAFSALGVGAVWGCEECRLPLNVVTGAVFGLVVGSGLFYGCLALLGPQVLSSSPGFVGVAFSNLAAGGVLGGSYHLMKTGSPG